MVDEKKTGTWRNFFVVDTTWPGGVSLVPVLVSWKRYLNLRLTRTDLKIVVTRKIQQTQEGNHRSNKIDAYKLLLWLLVDKDDDPQGMYQVS